MSPDINRQQRRRRRTWFGAAWLLLLQAAPGCLYDPDHPCDEGMEVQGDNLACVCAAGTISTPTGCATCGEHEVAAGSVCLCEPGYSRPTDDAPCEEAPSGLGVECDPAAPACAAPYDHCEAASGSGYCTETCAAPEDCEGGYACNADAICQRPPLGLGQACTSSDDCATTEATFCDLVVTHSCQVQGCVADPNSCFAGFECCDLTPFGLPLLCVPEGQCSL